MLMMIGFPLVAIAARVVMLVMGFICSIFDDTGSGTGTGAELGYDSEASASSVIIVTGLGIIFGGVVGLIAIMSVIGGN